MKLKRGSLIALPSSVQRLALNDTKVKSQSLAPLRGHAPAANGVIELDLSDIVQFIRVKVALDFGRTFSKIKVLKINRCGGYYTDVCLMYFSQHLLEVLEAHDSVLDDHDVRFYFPVSLRRLNIAGCGHVTPASALHMAALTNLEYLDVRGCPGLTDRAIQRYFKIPITNDNSDYYGMLQRMLPQCEVVSASSSSLNDDDDDDFELELD